MLRQRVREGKSELYIMVKDEAEVRVDGVLIRVMCELQNCKS